MKPWLKVSDNVHPDIRGGDEIDIRHYVKIKRLLAADPKTVRMSRALFVPRSGAQADVAKHLQSAHLILLFPLEYSRVENQLLSLSLSCLRSETI